MRFTYLAILATLFVGACSSTRLSYDDPSEAYNKGMDLYNAGKYVKAAEYFQGVFDFGRSHEYAADSRLFLARSYNESKQYLLAANEYQRFVQIYRNDERVEDAEFEYAMTFFNRSPKYQLDQTATEEAVRQLQRFANRYPTSSRLEEVGQKIAILRQKLARKQYQTAKLYERRELFEAAAVSFVEVFDKYPDSEWADDALLAASINYIAYAEKSVEVRKQERFDLALSCVTRLVQNFPTSPLVEEAEKIQSDLQSRSSSTS